MTNNPNVQPVPLDLAHFLPYRLSVVSNAISEAIAEVYREPAGLSMTEWRLLAVLAEQPGISAIELGRHTRIDKVAISRALKRLLERGLIRRTAQRTDRRRLKLRPTAEGQTLYEQIAPAVVAREQLILAGLSAADRSMLEQLLEKLSTALTAG